MKWEGEMKINNNISRRNVLKGAGATFVALEIGLSSSIASASNWPTKPITVVIMYGAGGGTDTITRVLVDEMAKNTGWNIKAINKPGAVGGIATKYVSSQKSDGYTILGAANYNKFVRVMGHMPADQLPWENWVFMQAANSLASWSVRPDSPFKTFDDVVKAAKKNPGKISISTSGTGGLWHELALLVSDSADIRLKFVPYKGGKKATLAGLQGETDIAGGGVHEHISLIRAGKLINLQQTGREDLKVDGITLPSIGSILPSTKPFLPFGGCYNLIMQRDTPAEVIKMVAAEYKKAVASDKFMSIAKKKFFDIDVKFGEDADKRAAQLETMTVHTFNKYADQMGKEVKNNKELGLPTPDNFEKWWPPKGYKPIKI